MFENILTFIDKNDKIIGILHAVYALIISVYGFVVKKNRFDIVYILCVLFTIITWTFYNGECILTYLIKKNKDSNYIAGIESTDLKDMYLLFGSKEILFYIVTISILVGCVSIYLVLKRNNYPNFVYYSFPLFQFLYTMTLRIQPENLHKNKLFLISQEFFKYYFILLFVYILYFNAK